MTPKGLLGRGDLLRALAQGGPAVARFWGLEARPLPPAVVPPAPEFTPAPKDEPEAPEVPELSQPAGAWAPLPFWMPEKYEPWPESEAKTQPPTEVLDLFHPPPRRPPPPSPLLTRWSRLLPVLSQQLTFWAEGRVVDSQLLVQLWSRGRQVRRLPKIHKRRWPRQLTVWLDRSLRLVPFWDDQTYVLAQLKKMIGPKAVTTQVLGDGPGRPPPHQPLLALSDLGAYGSPGEVRRWAKVGRQAARAGCTPAALAPVPAAQIPPKGAAWRAQSWERSGAKNPKTSPQVLSERLLTLLAASARIEPGLLRALRRLLGPDANAATEALAWQSPGWVVGPTGAGWRPEEAQKYRALLAQPDPDLEPLKKRALLILRRWHGADPGSEKTVIPQELWAAEVDLWRRILGPAGVSAAEATWAENYAQKMTATLADPAQAPAITHYWRRQVARVGVETYNHDPVWGPLTAQALKDLPQSPIPTGLSPEALKELLRQGPEQRWVWYQTSTGLTARPMREPAVGSPLFYCDSGPQVTLSWGNQSLHSYQVEPIPLTLENTGGQLQIAGGQGRYHLSRFSKPDWADAVGRDGYGLWAQVELVGVKFKLRYIPPGEFRMGSPRSEAGRFEREGPQHWVILPEGFWLGEVPVTQILWEGVMGNNPSEFKWLTRPVERVSWHDVQKFLEETEKLRPGLALGLPSEAQWEYACRAGTTTATYGGDLTPEDERGGAPELATIGWYRGNCGVDFELKNARASFVGQKGGTHPVGQKLANPWGLYDMLGNVWEWCRDGKRDYQAPAVTRPLGPEGPKVARVVRGGSWGLIARYLRAAGRLAVEPGLAYDYLGFRLCRGQTAPSP